MNVSETIRQFDNHNIVVVDAQGDSSLGYVGVDWKNATIIDHHRDNTAELAPRYLIDEASTSACELVWETMGRPKKIDRRVGICLLAGIISDTGHLKRGTSRTLANASEILRASDLRLDDVQIVFDSADDQDSARRISRLKAAQRLKFDRIGEWVVAVTEIGAFESAACQALLSVGADVAFSGSQKEDGFRITGRANNAAVTAGVHLGDMFNSIAAECGGQGGGHDGAAGLSGKGDVEAMLGICSSRTILLLKGKERQGRTAKESLL
jgi:nanoRNase/pAp phosphatase (c-di-AMP/oligoRNAs hydrolase)